MGSLVADTHAAVWYLAASSRLSSRAKAAIDAALAGGYPVWIPTICLVEIAYLIEKTRLPETAWESLLRQLAAPAAGFRAASFTVQAAEALRWIPVATVPDMPDRMIAATALALNLPLITCDRKIQAAPLVTIW